MDERDPGGDAPVRLQKVLAAAGLGSRRRCEELIAGGRVTVDGVVVTAMGTRVGPSAVVAVDGERIGRPDGHVTLALHKPADVLSAMSDARGRRTLAPYVAGLGRRAFHVGRLDADTTGLILLTSDGDLAHALAHPSRGVPKVYVAKVRGAVPRSLPATLLRGVELEDGPAACDACRVRAVGSSSSVVEVTLHEGRNRIVRRIFDAVGYPVLELARVRFGPISLGDLAPGETRVLGPREVGALLEAAGR